MKETFIGAPIKPIKGTFDMKAMTRGEPGLPRRFVWQDKEYMINSVIKKWKELSRDKDGGDDMYVRKHWFKIATTNGYTMKIYFDRQVRSKGQIKLRWWLYSVSSDEQK